MKKFKAFFAVVILVILLTTISLTSLILYPPTVAEGISIPMPSFPAISMPPMISFPPLIEFGAHWTQLDTDTGPGFIPLPSGLDSNSKLTIAVASFRLGGSNIHFYDGSEWRKTSNNHYLSKLEWGNVIITSTLYATSNFSNKVYLTSNPYADSPIWEEIGSSGSGVGEFSNPNGMHYSMGTGLYVVDTDNNRIQLRNNGSWEVFSTFDSSSHLMDIVTVGGLYGSTYVTDMANNCIWVKSNYFGGAWTAITDSQFLIAPSCIDADSEGNIYVLSNVANSDPETRCILKYEDGNFTPVVISGNGLGEISPSSNPVEEFAINAHDKIIYCDLEDNRVIKESNTNNSYSSISINGEYPTITNDQTELNLSFSPEIEEAVIKANPICPYAKIDGNATYPLAFGLNELSVSCTSEEGFTKTLNINITRELSDNALLSDITIDSVSIPGFNPNIYAYTDITVPNSSETIDLVGISQNENASVVGSGTLTLNTGSNQLLLYVTAQDGTTFEQYLIVVTREEAPATPTPSPSPTPGASSTPTPSPSPTASPTETPAPSATPSATPTSTPAPTNSASPSATPAPSSPEPSVTPEASETPTTSETPGTTEPSTIETPAQTSVPSPTPDPDSNDSSDDPNPLLPIIYVLVGVILLGGGVFAGVMIAKKGKGK